MSEPDLVHRYVYDVGTYASLEFHEPTDALYVQPSLPSSPDDTVIDGFEEEDGNSG
jgi:hypothetical protein